MVIGAGHGLGALRGDEHPRGRPGHGGRPGRDDERAVVAVDDAQAGGAVAEGAPEGQRVEGLGARGPDVAELRDGQGSRLAADDDVDGGGRAAQHRGLRTDLDGHREEGAPAPAAGGGVGGRDLEGDRGRADVAGQGGDAQPGRAVGLDPELARRRGREPVARREGEGAAGGVDDDVGEVDRPRAVAVDPDERVGLDARGARPAGRDVDEPEGGRTLGVDHLEGEHLGGVAHGQGDRAVDDLRVREPEDPGDPQRAGGVVGVDGPGEQVDVDARRTRLGAGEGVAGHGRQVEADPAPDADRRHRRLAAGPDDGVAERQRLGRRRCGDRDAPGGGVEGGPARELGVERPERLDGGALPDRLDVVGEHVDGDRAARGDAHLVVDGHDGLGVAGWGDGDAHRALADLPVAVAERGR